MRVRSSTFDSTSTACTCRRCAVSRCPRNTRRPTSAGSTGSNKSMHPFLRSTTLADDYERGYLLLADIYIQKSKFDLAEELCWRCLASNKSCGKAWEFLGVAKEKEAAYKDAASQRRDRFLSNL